MTDEEAARLIGVDLHTYKGILYRLEEAGIPSRNEAGILYSRRLVRDHALYLSGKVSGKKGGGNPALKKRLKKSRIENIELKGGLKVPYIGVEIPASLLAISGFEELFNDFLANRAAKKAKATPRAQAIILEKLAEQPLRSIEALKEAISRNWTGFDWSWMDNVRGTGKGYRTTPDAQPLTNFGKYGPLKYDD
jgi:hypothetical protein